MSTAKRYLKPNYHLSNSDISAVFEREGKYFLEIDVTVNVGTQAETGITLHVPITRLRLISRQIESAITQDIATQELLKELEQARLEVEATQEAIKFLQEKVDDPQVYVRYKPRARAEIKDLKLVLESELKKVANLERLTNAE